MPKGHLQSPKERDPKDLKRMLPANKAAAEELEPNVETPPDLKAGGRRRPKADFMSDQQLEEKINCPKCNEQLLKAF